MSTSKCEEKCLLPTTSSTGGLEDVDGANARFRFSRRVKIWLTAVAAFALVSAHVFYSSGPSAVLIHPWAPRVGAEGGNRDIVCPQTEELIPTRNGDVWTHVGDLFSTESFRNRSVEALGGAVRVPTESFDDMGPIDEDPRWKVFVPFHEYLLKTFPLVHTTLNITKVNTYGLVYLWQGLDRSLKPVMFAAHQDVVPVDPTTVDQWEHPPFSGHFDGTRVWGRGSVDFKSGIIGTLTSVEVLLEHGFKPTRSVLIAFGFDEEISGRRGAGKLATYILETFGENGIALLIDEGSGIENDKFGGVVALPGIAEKGYFDVRVAVTSPGGHSSIPPPHTSIGILSALLVKFEADPVISHLGRENPMYKAIQCQAEHAPAMPRALRWLIRRSARSDCALRRLERRVFRDPMLKSLIGTTLAIDLINGGVKTNALPERAWAVVNHRIATESSVGAVKGYDTELLRELAAEFNLTYDAFGVLISERGAPARGTLTLSDAWNAALEPAPVTPTGSDAGAFHVLSGTIKASYNAHMRGLKGKEIYVSPAIMSGNTDTRHYWKLTENIFRYNHYDSGDYPLIKSGIHTVNESINANSFVEMIRFYAALILNADESSLL